MRCGQEQDFYGRMGDHANYFHLVCAQLLCEQHRRLLGTLARKSERWF